MTNADEIGEKLSAPITKDDMDMFALDFDDASNFQDKVIDVVGGAGPGDVGDVTLPASPSPGSPSSSPAVNLGIVIPVVVVSVFLLAVGTCLLWHTWYDRLRRRAVTFKLGPTPGMGATSTGSSSFCRSSHSSLSWEDWARGDEWRASTRSTTPLRAAQGPMSISNVVNRDYRPRLGKISESPEDRLAEYRRKINPGLCDTDDSIYSILSNLHFEMPPVHNPVHLPYGHPTYMGDVCHSYPNLLMSSHHAPFYNLTWLASPTGKRAAYSDPNIQEMAALRAMRNIIPPSDPSSGHSSFTAESWNKSPYHPNYNTPTNGSSTESNLLPPGAILNHTRSLPDSGTSGPSLPVSMVDLPASLRQGSSQGSGMCSGDGTSESCLGGSVGGVVSNPKSCFTSQSSSKSTSALMEMEGTGSTVHTNPCTPIINASAALSLPSDMMASWRCHQDTTLRHSHGHQTADSSDHANTQSDSLGPSSNASMCALIGSTDTSLFHTSGHHSGNTSLHQGALSASTGGGTPGTAWLSTNTSTCAQLDSCESSTCSGATAARHGAQSRNTSGYLGGPSHSTSLIGTAALAGHGSVGQLPGASNSLHLTDIHGLSAIPGIPSLPSTGDTSSIISSSIAQSFLSTSVRSAPAVMARMGEPSPEWSLGDHRTADTTESPSIDRSGTSSGTSTAPTVSSDCLSGTADTEACSLSVNMSRLPRMTPDLHRLQVVPRTPALHPGSGSFNDAFEWDTFPFYTPPILPGPHGLISDPRPTPGPVRRWKQPVLSDMRYWV